MHPTQVISYRGVECHCAFPCGKSDVQKRDMARLRLCCTEVSLLWTQASTVQLRLGLLIHCLFQHLSSLFTMKPYTFLTSHGAQCGDQKIITLTITFKMYASDACSCIMEILKLQSREKKEIKSTVILSLAFQTLAYYPFRHFPQHIHSIHIIHIINIQSYFQQNRIVQYIIL